MTRCTPSWRLPWRQGPVVLVLALFGGCLQAANLFEGADLALGEQLIREKQCNACHQKNVGGDGSAIYRPTGRINAPAALRGMVEQCNTTLNLALFPDEVSAIAAVLQRDHYRFK